MGALANAPLSELVPFFGNASREIQRRARGLDDRPVVKDGAPKSVGEESTFESDVLDQEVPLRRALPVVVARDAVVQEQAVAGQHRALSR